MLTYRRDKAILATLKSYLIDAQFRSEYEDFIAPEKLEAVHFHEERGPRAYRDRCSTLGELPRS
jgi:hypothetical protein